MTTVLVSKIGKGKRLHLVDESFQEAKCGRILDGTEHKFKSVSIQSHQICISYRVARTKGG